MPEAVDQVRVTFGIPADREPIGAIAIGYDAETSKPDHSTQRRPLDQMVHYSNW